jgi:hypothetical protein
MAISPALPLGFRRSITRNSRHSGEFRRGFWTLAAVLVYFRQRWRQGVAGIKVINREDQAPHERKTELPHWDTENDRPT